MTIVWNKWDPWISIFAIEAIDSVAFVGVFSLLSNMTTKSGFQWSPFIIISTAERCSSKRCFQRFPAHPIPTIPGIDFEHLKGGYRKFLLFFHRFSWI